LPEQSSWVNTANTAYHQTKVSLVSIASCVGSYPKSGSVGSQQPPCSVFVTDRESPHQNFQRRDNDPTRQSCRRVMNLHLGSSESAVRALLVSGDPPTIEQLSQSLQEFGSLDQSLHRYSKRHPPREHPKVRDGGGRPQIRRAEQVGSRTGASLAIQSHDSGICDHPERKRIGLPVISPQASYGAATGHSIMLCTF